MFKDFDKLCPACINLASNDEIGDEVQDRLERNVEYELCNAHTYLDLEAQSDMADDRLQDIKTHANLRLYRMS